MRTQEERDQQTVDIMTVVCGAAVLLLLVFAVVVLAAYIW